MLLVCQVLISVKSVVKVWQAQVFQLFIENKDINEIGQ